MRFSILTLNPGFFPGALDEGMVRVARQKGLLHVAVVAIRDFTDDRYGTTDDYPYGGGAGMVMKVEPILRAWESVRRDSGGGSGTAGPRVLVTSPQGRVFTQAWARELALEREIAVLCGRYKGIDERVIPLLNAEEISVGDYVLSGGEPAAIVILDALARPGTATQSTVTWKNAGTTVTFDRTAVESGTRTPCPWVATAGADPGPNEADARHTVRRYLSRLVGTPLDPSDKEATYPLICKASAVDWDPTGTGSPTQPPLANNPGKLTGTTKFADQEIRSDQLRADYLAVQVPVTNSAGVTQTRTFTLTEVPDGYCIGDVSS